ncbi:unnamed protein product, partial [Ectocarpus sp. 12 AP-2014]
CNTSVNTNKRVWLFTGPTTGVRWHGGECGLLAQQGCCAFAHTLRASRPAVRTPPAWWRGVPPEHQCRESRKNGPKRVRGAATAAAAAAARPAASSRAGAGDHRQPHRRRGGGRHLRGAQEERGAG